MTSPRLKNRGMTLIELTVSMAIGLILLLLAAAMLGSSGEGYERITGSIGSDREARDGIGQLAADLCGACFHKDSTFETSLGSRFGFLSLQPAAAQTDAGRIGDLCAIFYYLKDLTIGEQTVRCLMRGFRESGETFTALREDRVASLFTERANLDDPVAFGVISFTVLPQYLDTNGSWVEWQNHGAIGPERLQVKLTLARRNLVQKLKQSSDWNVQSARNQTANPHPDIEVYETPLRFGNHANR